MKEVIKGIIEITTITEQMTVVVKITDATEEEIKEITPTMIGNVQNVKIQIYLPRYGELKLCLARNNFKMIATSFKHLYDST